MEQAVPILFYCLAVLTVGGGIGVVVVKNPVHAACSLLFTLAMVAGLLLLRDAVLLGLIHGVLCCAGAVALQRWVSSGRAQQAPDSSPAFVSGIAPLAVVIGVFFGVVAAFGLLFGVPAPGQGDGAALQTVNGEEWGNVVALGAVLLTTYLVPLVVVLMACAVAVIGARRFMDDTAELEDGEGEAKP